MNRDLLFMRPSSRARRGNGVLPDASGDRYAAVSSPGGGRDRRQQEIALAQAPSAHPPAAPPDNSGKSRRDEIWEARRRGRERGGPSPQDEPGHGGWEGEHHSGGHSDHRAFVESEDTDHRIDSFPPIHRNGGRVDHHHPQPPVREPDTAIHPEDMLPPISGRGVEKPVPPPREKGAKTRYREELQQQMADKAAVRAMEKRVGGPVVINPAKDPPPPVSAREGSQVCLPCAYLCDIAASPTEQIRFAY